MLISIFVLLQRNPIIQICWSCSFHWGYHCFHAIIFWYFSSICFCCCCFYSTFANYTLLGVLLFVSLGFFSLRDKERAGERQKERERERERIPSRLHAVSAEPHAGLDLTNCEIMTWAEIKSPTWGSIPWSTRSWPERKSRVRRLIA